MQNFTMSYILYKLRSLNLQFQCFSDCPSGFYGYRCKNVCSEKCLIYADCDHIDGTCSDGCQAGYIGKLCNNCKIMHTVLHCIH